jgi:signal peptidase I
MMPGRAKQYLKGVLGGYALAIGGAATVALLLRVFVVEAFRIPTDFMTPTLLPGDHIFVNKLAYGRRFWSTSSQPKRGDVVIFSFPNDAAKDYIKRVVAIEGDKVEIRDGVVYLNGKKELESAKYHVRWEGATQDARNMMPVTVPSGHVFVLGDNRAKGQDSRTWGFLPAAQIKGRAALVWFSPNWSRLMTWVN